MVDPIALCFRFALEIRERSQPDARTPRIDPGGVFERVQKPAVAVVAGSRGAITLRPIAVHRDLVVQFGEFRGVRRPRRQCLEKREQVPLGMKVAYRVLDDLPGVGVGLFSVPRDVEPAVLLHFGFKPVHVGAVDLEPPCVLQPRPVPHRRTRQFSDESCIELLVANHAITRETAPQTLGSTARRSLTGRSNCVVNGEIQNM